MRHNINTAIAKENRLFENDRGLAEYIHDEAHNKKVYSLYPSVEIVDGELWGVLIAGLKGSLSGEETAELLDFVTGQNSDGYVLKVLSSVPSKLLKARSTSAFGWRSSKQNGVPQSQKPSAGDVS